MKSEWSLERGANVLPGGGVRFSVWAPRAQRVEVEIVDRKESRSHEMTALGGNVFSVDIRDAAEGTDYLFRLDGKSGRPDPASRLQPEGVHGPSRVVEPDAFRWTDAKWRGLGMADLVIYELHVGTFSETGTFDAAIPYLAELREMGITAIEIMPVAQFPGERNWGYDGVLPYAVQNSYGGPEELRVLVNAAHRLGLAVILDVVYNHIGPEGNYLGEYGPYFTETYRTPWGKAVNFDGPESDEVRRYFIDNALYWITEYHIDGLRLDAVHGIYDFGARHILAELADAVKRQGRALGRRVFVIGESDLNDPRIVRSSDAGGYGLDGQWSDDLHHAIHAALTEETAGYYSDFGGIVPIATALSRRFVYDGRYSAHRKRRHGAPCTDVAGDRFVVCIQNHDQVGNRATGDRLTTILPFEKRKLAAALVLLAPYVPLLFMGEEYGEPNPFQYFVSHGDAKLVEAVRRGRRDEFASFGWGDDVPDPQSEETFARSRLDRSRANGADNDQIRALYRDLLGLRSRERALRPGVSQIHAVADEGRSTITLHLVPDAGAEVVSVFNLSNEERETTLPHKDVSSWQPLLSTADERYGGSGTGGSAARNGRIAPWSAIAWRRERGTT
jgi:maltooligosyltrehalose trehalohydrolase